MEREGNNLCDICGRELGSDVRPHHYTQLKALIKRMYFNKHVDDIHICDNCGSNLLDAIMSEMKVLLQGQKKSEKINL